MSNFAQDFVEALDDTGEDIIVVFIVDMNNLRAQEADLLVVFCYHASWYSMVLLERVSSEETHRIRDRASIGATSQRGGKIPFM